MALIEQEVSPSRSIEIPEEVRDAYRLWRPTPLFRARRLERALDTPGAHLLQVRGRLARRLAQAEHGRAAGLRQRAGRGRASSRTETGAGQWGSSLAFACALFGLECEVFMVGSSYDQKPYRRSMMETWGATVHRSPERPHAGRARRRRRHPTGSLGIAISEAVEVAAQRRRHATTRWARVLNHVLLHQTVIGQEAIAQMELAGDEPDVVVACVGGGSNFGGIAFPLLRRVLRGDAQDALRRRRAGGLPDADRGRLRATTSATRRG